MEDLLQIDNSKEAPAEDPTYRPRTVAEVGVRPSVLEDLALKILYLSGPFSVLELSKLTRLSYEVANEFFLRLRTETFCQVTGMAHNIPNIAITSLGRTRAMELLSLSHYSGPAPVSLATYVSQVREQSVKNVIVRPADVQRAFSHLVLDEKTLWQLGTALNSGSSLFLYGPAGAGKTSIAETLTRVIAKDDVWLPYAVEVEARSSPSTIRLFTIAFPKVSLRFAMSVGCFATAPRCWLAANLRSKCSISNSTR